MSRKIKVKLLSWYLNRYKRIKKNKNRTDIEHCLAVVRSMIAKNKYGFLITHSSDGKCSARLVEPIVDDEFVFWIGTNPNLRKVEEVKMDPNVTFAYQDTKGHANLIIYGKAEIETDLKLKRKYWKGAWKLFFPGGPRSNDYVLIRIETKKMELMSFEKNIVPEPFGLKPVVLEKVNGKWVVVDG